MVVWITDAHHTVDQNCPFSTMRPVPYNEWAEIQRLQRWFPLCRANALCLVFIQHDEKVSFWTICLHVPLLDCVSLLVQWCQVRPDVFQWDMRVNSHQGASTRLSLWESARGGPAVTEVRTDGHCFTHMLPSNNKYQHVTLLSSTCSIFALI